MGVDDGVLAATAMVGYDGHRGWVNSLAVSPERRRRGLASALVAETQARLVALGCPKLNLQLRDTNESALAFWRALGFEPDPVICLGRRLIPDG